METSASPSTQRDRGLPVRLVALGLLLTVMSVGWTVLRLTTLQDAVDEIADRGLAVTRAIGRIEHLDEVLTSQEKMIARLDQGDTGADREAMKEAYRNDIVRTRLHCRNQPNFELIEIHYKAAIEDPAGVARAVNEFLGE